MRSVVAFLAALVVVQAGDCVQVSGDHILLADIAGALPLVDEHQVTPAVLSRSPDPGTRRVLTGQELVNALHSRGLAVRETEVRDVCVERFTGPLEEDLIREALSRVPEIGGARIDILDFSKVKVPDGELRFSITGVPKPPLTDPHSPVTWRGEFIYDGRRTLPVWVKLVLSRDMMRVRATRDIPRDADLTPDMVEVASRSEFPVGSRPAPTSVEEVVGKRVLRSLRAGDVLESRWLGEPLAIARGQSVQVTVEIGSVRVTFARDAVTDGQLGQTVLLRDKKTGRTLKAVADGQGSAVVRLSAGDRS